MFIVIPLFLFILWLFFLMRKIAIGLLIVSIPLLACGIILLVFLNTETQRGANSGADLGDLGGEFTIAVLIAVGLFIVGSAGIAFGLAMIRKRITKQE